MLPIDMADLTKEGRISEIKSMAVDAMEVGSGGLGRRGLEGGGRRRLTGHLGQWGRRGGSVGPLARRWLRVSLRDVNWCLLRLGRASVGLRALFVFLYPSSIPLVSLRYRYFLLFIFR
jgi:hypothetical protein